MKEIIISNNIIKKIKKIEKKHSESKKKCHYVGYNFFDNLHIFIIVNKDYDDFYFITYDFDLKNIL